MLEFLQDYWSILLAGLIVIIAVVILIVITRKKPDEKDEPKVDEVQPTTDEQPKDVEEITQPITEVVAKPKTSAKKKAVAKDKPTPKVKTAPKTKAVAKVEPIAEDKPIIEDKPVVKAKTSATKSKTKETKQEVAPVKKEDKTPSATELIESVVLYHVAYDKEANDWFVKKDGAKRASKRANTKEEAIKIAKQLCESTNGTVVAHNKTDKI